MGALTLGLSSVFAGVHLKFSPSVCGNNVIGSVRQIVASAPASKVTRSTTLTRTVVVFMHPFSSSVTVNVVVLLGNTRGLEVLAFNITELTFGVHVKLPKPLACN